MGSGCGGSAREARRRLVRVLDGRQHELAGAAVRGILNVFLQRRLDEGILFVRDPQLHRQPQPLGLLASADQQVANFVGAAGKQSLAEPDPLGVDFTNHVEGLVTFLRLQPVDGQHQGLDASIGSRQLLGVLLAAGHQGLVAAQVGSRPT